MHSEKRREVVLMIPPQIVNVNGIIRQSLQLHNLTDYKEIEPKAGCRRFLLKGGE